MSTHSDDTQENRSEESRPLAADTQRLLGEAMAHAVDGIIVADARQYSMPILYANPAFLSLTGYTEAEIIGRDCRFLQGEDTDPAAVGQIRDALHAGRWCRVTLLNYKKDGQPFWNDLVISPVRDERDTLTHFVGIQHDATVLRQAQDAVRESESRFRQVADAVPNIVWTAKPDGSVDYYNQRWHDYTGLTFEETRDWDWMPVVHEGERVKMVSTYRAAVKEATGYEHEFRLQRVDGEFRWHLGRGVPIKNDAGQVVKWVGSYTDITAHKQAAQMQTDLFEREHTIAAEFQAALQPDLPEAIPGIAVAKYYESALEASEGVGGDFYDCYILDAAQTCVALVVGDISGKGLNAAVQVAAVRHGLRAALFLLDSVAEAVSRLNDMLVEQASLASFATLFVGAYDSKSRELCYVNCGQEPALLRHAGTGVVEELASTGPILGSFAGMSFQEKTVKLSPGDAVAIFSDGLTEVGISRLSMLGIEGVSVLLGHLVPGEGDLDVSEMAERLVLHIISGVDAAAAGGVMRDDVCLLIAVVEGGKAG